MSNKVPSNKVPQIRFNGYSDPWEQRKLGEIANRILRKNKNNISNLPLTISAQSGLIAQNKFFDKQVASQNLSNYLLLYKGDFAYNKSYSNGYPYGAVKRLEKFNCGVVSSLYIAFKPTHVLPNFLAEYYETTKWYVEIYKRAAEGARNHGLLNISATDFFNSDISLPKIRDEQEKIGQFFQSLDKTITLHEEKQHQLEQLKKALLQKMFPKNGARVPELRFEGFTNDWEERKLTDLATTYIGLVTTMTENYATEGTLLIRNSDIKEGRFDLSNPIYLEEQFAEKNKTRRMRKGDVVTVHTGDIGTSAIINSELDGTIGFATITTRPKKELDSNFLAWYFNSNYHKKYAKRMSTGDGRSNYNMKDFNKNVIPTPKIAEQQKIGSFFKQLDETLALHQRKLEKLQELKKGCLQKMFC